MAAAVLSLAACGGGGGSGGGDNVGGGPSGPSDPLVSGTDVPTSATTSSAGAFAFVNQVASTSSDSTDPLVLGDVTLATSESDDPDPSI